jgi:hypothetical protein
MYSPPKQRPRNTIQQRIGRKQRPNRSNEALQSRPEQVIFKRVTDGRWCAHRQHLFLQCLCCEPFDETVNDFGVDHRALAKLGLRAIVSSIPQLCLTSQCSGFNILPYQSTTASGRKKPHVEHDQSDSNFLPLLERRRWRYGNTKGGFKPYQRRIQATSNEDSSQIKGGFKQIKGGFKQDQRRIQARSKADSSHTKGGFKQDQRRIQARPKADQSCPRAT